MAQSMLSNQPLTLKTTITTVMWTGATFEIFETGIVLTRASIVFRNKLQLERLVVDIATDWVCTIVLRGLDQSQTKTEVIGNKKERTSWAEGYITVLASDLLDVDNTGDEQVLTGNVKFTGNVDIDWNLNVDSTLTAWTLNLTNLSVSWKSKPVPKVADVTERNTLYTSPVDGNMVDVEWVGLQIYRTSAGGWVTLDEGTPTPDATELVKGKAYITTTVEALLWVINDEIMTPYTTKVVMDNVSTVLYDTTTEITGESLVAWDSFFKESGITFAWATTPQRIWEISNLNSRVEWVIIGSWVSGTTQKLSLSKTGTPTQALWIRIETDSAGTPSGTLADPNSITTVAQASLTTSLADTTITFPWAFTLTKWVKYHVVLYQGTYGSETISASNYYNVGYSTNNTPLRGSKTYDNAPTVTDSNWIVYTTSTANTWAAWVRVTANLNTNIISVTKNSVSTATRCQVFTDGWALQGTATFIGNVATFWTPLAITSGTTYRVLADNSGASYTFRSVAVTYPFAGTAVNTIWWYFGGNNGATAFNIEAISTAGNGWSAYNPAIQFYTSSTLIEDVLLMKTDADFTYKLPTDFPRISRQTVGMWSTVMFDFWWVTKQCTWIKNNNAFISNTPWALSTTAWTNSYKVGKFTDTNQLYINPVTL